MIRKLNCVPALVSVNLHESDKGNLYEFIVQIPDSKIDEFILKYKIGHILRADNINSNKYKFSFNPENEKGLKDLVEDAYVGKIKNYGIHSKILKPLNSRFPNCKYTTKFLPNTKSNEEIKDLEDGCFLKVNIPFVNIPITINQEKKKIESLEKTIEKTEEKEFEGEQDKTPKKSKNYILKGAAIAAGVIFVYASGSFVKSKINDRFNEKQQYAAKLALEKEIEDYKKQKANLLTSLGGKINHKTNEIEFTIKYKDSLWGKAEDVYRYKYDGRSPSQEQGSKDVQEVDKILTPEYNHIFYGLKQNPDNLKIGQKVKFKYNPKWDLLTIKPN